MRPRLSHSRRSYALDRVRVVVPLIACLSADTMVAQAIELCSVLWVGFRLDAAPPWRTLQTPLNVPGIHDGHGDSDPVLAAHLP